MKSYKVQFRESYGWDDWTAEEDAETALKIADQMMKTPSPSEEGMLEIRVVRVQKDVIFHAKRPVGDWLISSPEETPGV